MSQETQRDPVKRAADIARIVVHAEYAYDIVDEMASNPDRFVDSLYKLSRLVTKVYNDLEDIRNVGEEYRDAYEWALNNLKYWPNAMNELAQYLNDKRKDEKEYINEVKRFAALAISPDNYSLQIRELLEKR